MNCSTRPLSRDVAIREAVTWHEGRTGDLYGFNALGGLVATVAHRRRSAVETSYVRLARVVYSSVVRRRAGAGLPRHRAA